ncbi:polysaccharide deacetylase family protein [Gloeobacter kilaueensis]|uniref:Polysaccharide deacetylase n=1 Tax=Gloeobacter kilaueensis (strain ATCC BAA-2537 / CCAP 1431/1 / ULC 316 / JS1) TaxID=1183438 RepID=U5QEW3_GLOK1|nr:polysaccharide deacetylase family protein [Gloeobacter kilaueensis]AGY57497.1 polysaccharide deacetylase [Gloeobacter kilaueensis JS1]
MRNLPRSFVLALLSLFMLGAALYLSRFTPPAPASPATPPAVLLPPIPAVASLPEPPPAASVTNPPVPASFQGKIFKQGHLKRGEKVVALTFDDGPWPDSTRQVLAILRRNQITATFFCIGRHIQEHPELLKEVAVAGQVLGNHTWNHLYRPLSTARAAGEIDRTEALIKKITGVETRLFRPPGGVLGNGQVAYARRRDYAVVLWSVDSGDSHRHPTAAGMIRRVLAGVRPGGVVLLHDGGGLHPTVHALPQIIAGLKAKGYRFVTVPELMAMQVQQQAPPAIKVPLPATSAGQ